MARAFCRALDISGCVTCPKPLMHELMKSDAPDGCTDLSSEILLARHMTPVPAPAHESAQPQRRPPPNPTPYPLSRASRKVGSKNLNREAGSFPEKISGGTIGPHANPAHNGLALPVRGACCRRCRCRCCCCSPFSAPTPRHPLSPTTRAQCVGHVHDVGAWQSMHSAGCCCASAAALPAVAHPCACPILAPAA